MSPPPLPLLRRLARRVLASARAEIEPRTTPRLVAARELVPRFREAGGGSARAITMTRAQVGALRHLMVRDAEWAHLVTVVARAGDPWNADDWPDGFDALLLCAALCDDVAFECARCPVGVRQGGSSCAEPRSLFGHVLTLVARGDRAALLQHLDAIETVLRGEARWDLATTRLIP